MKVYTRDTNQIVIIVLYKYLLKNNISIIRS